MSSSSASTAIRILVVHSYLLGGRDEPLEVQELIGGLIEQPRDVQILATDGKKVYRPRLVDGAVQYEAVRPLWKLPFPDADVVSVHMPFPPVHLLLAVLGRARGAKVLLSPMSMLTSDFATRSWFNDSRWIAFKPLLVKVLRALWSKVAHAVLCLSEQERLMSGLAPDRCALVPWPAPVTPLGQAARRDPISDTPKPDAPVAFISRFDVYRKGIDRLCTWLEAYEGELPRPAVLLLAHGEDDPPEGFADLVTKGHIEWDPHTTGSDLVTRLDSARGVMLLSRWDGQPRVLREAACMGLPTISTPSSMFAEMVEALEVGAVVDGNDPRDIQRAFTLISGQRSSPELALSLMDRRGVASFLVSIMDSLLAGRSPASNYYEAFAQRSAHPG